jgi:hypothetical protein
VWSAYASGWAAVKDWPSAPHAGPEASLDSVAGRVLGTRLRVDIGESTANSMAQERAPGTQLAPIFLIAAAVLLADFTRLPDFGLYEDDYWSIAPHLNDPVHKLWGLLVKDFSGWPTGRPLNYFLPAALSVVGSKMGGLEGIYVLSAAWLVLNAALVFLIVRRLTSQPAGLVAALAYVLFPADSTKILLVHAAHIQGAMTFLLAGTWLWLRGGPARAASYPVAALSLLAYETAFLPFLAVPLLWAADRRTTLRTWAVHLPACAALVALVSAIRLSTGDARAAEAVHQPGQMIYRMATSLLIGPLTSGRSLLDAAIQGARHLDPLSLLAAALILVGFGAACQAGAVRRERAAGEAFDRWPRWLNTSRDATLPWWWLLGGALMVWSGSYALTLTNYPPTQTLGRMTSTHIAAGWPVSIAVAAVFEGARRRGAGSRRIAVAMFAAWAVCLVAYQHDLQRQYVRAWQLQRTFWRQVVALAPEAGPGWTVIVGGTPAESGAAIGANSWSDYLVYRLIFRRGFDAMNGFDAGGPDFAHVGKLRDLVPFRRVGDHVEWKPQFYSGEFVTIDPTRLALLVDDQGRLRRVSELATPIGKLAASSAAPSPARTSWPSTPVSRLLFPERVP